MGAKRKFNKDYFKKLREESSKSYYGIPALNWGEMVDGKYVMTNRYDFKWRYVKGEKKILTPLDLDLYSYILNFKKHCEEEGREISIHIGCDSQSYLSYTRFILALCIKVQRNGVNVLISTIDMPKIYDYRYRLLRETDISTEFIRNNKVFFKNIGCDVEIHADYNQQTNHKSSGVVSEASNYLKTVGFNLILKPKSWSASYAADNFC